MSEAHAHSTIEFYPQPIAKVTKEDHYIHFSDEKGVILKVEGLTNDIFRLRFTTDGIFENDFSYAISSKFENQKIELKLEENESEYVVSSDSTTLRIQKLDFKTKFEDAKGNLICKDEKGFHWEENYKAGGNIVQMSKQAQPEEHYYGMGDKPMHLNLRGKRIQNWGTDEYGFAKDKDPLYKNIPFYIGYQQHIAYGIFFDNSFRSFFDFASERRSVTSFWADGGEMNYYFINGPQLIDVTKQYTMLTGVPDLPPMWALGYHQCKWSYYPESVVREITTAFREKDIPCDAIYLDIDYMDGFRCFTWDKEKFPTPKKMVADLAEQGFKTVVIIDPGIKVDPEYDVFKDGVEKDMFCRRADGPFMKGKVWPGDCYFPDFTSPKVRKWWADLFEGLIDTGVRGVWNDMNEPALFEVESKTFPPDVRHDYDGNPCSHRKAHNVYGMQMARGTMKGIKKFLKPKNQRPFVITRSAYSGAQRYTSAWTGDNIATWEHLWVANVQCQRMAVSGFSFVGSDVGGFTEHPTPELFLRWVQLATFHPFFRVHSSGDHGIQEPWTFGDEVTDIVRNFIKLRYKLLPYLYTTFYQYTNQGTPMLRPLSFEDQEDRDTLYRTDEFLFGDHILVCPIIEPNSKGRYVYLPKGQWVNYWTNEVIEGGKQEWIDADMETIPVLMRMGSVIPFYPSMNYVGEKSVEQLKLNVYVGGTSVQSEIYIDSGDGYDHRNGIYNINTFEVTTGKNSFQLTQERKGHYQSEYATYLLRFIGLNFTPSLLKINGIELSIAELNMVDGAYELVVDKKFWEVKIQ